MRWWARAKKGASRVEADPTPSPSIQHALGPSTMCKAASSHGVALGLQKTDILDASAFTGLILPWEENRLGCFWTLMSSREQVGEQGKRTLPQVGTKLKVEGREAKLYWRVRKALKRVGSHRSGDALLLTVLLVMRGRE